MPKITKFWWGLAKSKACGQTVLPDTGHFYWTRNWWKMPKFKNSNATFFSNFQTFKVAKKCLDYLDLKALLYSTFAVSRMMLMSLRLQFPSSSWNTSPSSMQARPLAFKRNFLTPAESHEMQITFTFAKILHFRSSIIAYILWKFQQLRISFRPLFCKYCK